MTRWLPLLPFLAGCPVEKLDDTAPGADTDPAEGTDRAEDARDTAGPDHDSGGDTGGDDTRLDDTAPLAQVYWLVELETAEAAFRSALLGFGAYSFREEDWACTILGTLADEGPGPEGCPDCAWAFDLGPATDGTIDGPSCEGFRDTIFSDPASIDGYFDWGWGFAAAHTYYGSDGTPYPLDETLFFHRGDGWELFAFNYGDRFQMIQGDASSLSVQVQATSKLGYIYYYYYP